MKIGFKKGNYKFQAIIDELYIKQIVKYMAKNAATTC